MRFPGRIHSSASVVAATPDEVEHNNIARTVLHVDPFRARLKVDKRVARVTSTGRVAFAITVRNAGRTSAHSVRVCDRAPAGLALRRTPGAKRSGRRACWTIPLLGPRARRTFRVTATLNANRVVNTASASATNARVVGGQAVARAFSPRFTG